MRADQLDRNDTVRGPHSVPAGLQGPCHLMRASPDRGGTQFVGNVGREDKALQCLSGIFQALGGAFILVGGFAAASLSYVPSRHVGLEWLLTVYVTPMCGAYILTAAFAFRAIVAANTDLAARVYDWETAGAVREPRPQLRCCSAVPRNVLWWGGVFLTLGALVLDVGTTARLAGQFWTVHYSKAQMLILEKISLAAGGLFLMVGAGCYIAKEVGWMVSKGIMCPPTRKDWRSYTFWMNWATFWGAMLYFGRGFLPIQYSTLLPRTFRLVNALGYGVGSMFMIAGGVLAILKMAKREDDPEVALHQKVQGADAEALSGKLLAMAEVLGHSRDKLSAPDHSGGHPGPSKYLS